MRVKYSYLEEQFKDYQTILNKIGEVVKTGDFTLGKAVQEFEEKFAAYSFKDGKYKKIEDVRASEKRWDSVMKKWSEARHREK